MAQARKITRSKTARARGAAAAPPAVKPAELPVFAIARQLRSWAESVLGVAGSAADLTLNLAKARAHKPGQKAAIEKAGSMLRHLRETANMTAKEVGQAIDLTDQALIDQAESGKVALPFEVILRLAAVLGRRDPVTFVMKLTRSYNPDLWKALEDLGVGRLVVQGARERELANLYRSSDAARKLSDEEFAAVLGFTQAAFDMAVDFRHKSAGK